MHARETVKYILEKHGFRLDSESSVGDGYKLNLDNGWQVSAYCAFATNIDGKPYEYIHVSLFDCIGTQYDFKSASSLDTNIDRVVAVLKHHSDDDAILKCEKCRTRYVSPKIPPEGKKWKPFLSCKGMMIVGSGKKKDVMCAGTSRQLPAVVKL